MLSTLCTYMFPYDNKRIYMMEIPTTVEYILFDPFDNRYGDNIHCFKMSGPSMIHYTKDIMLSCIGEDIDGYEINDDNPLVCYSGYIAQTSVSDWKRWRKYSLHITPNIDNFLSYEWIDVQNIFNIRKGYYNILEYVKLRVDDDNDILAALVIKYISPLKTPLDRVVERLKDLDIQNKEISNGLALSIENILDLYDLILESK